MKCPKCQHENKPSAKFCAKCGTKMPTVCPNCGTEVEPVDAFCTECGTDLKGKGRKAKGEDTSTSITTTTAVAPPEQQNITGEYRLVTALFADISGFSSMSQKLPTEAVVKKTSQCFKTIVDTVHRYEGSINRFIGDCVLALFGAPITHENDPERAILAALDIQKEAAQLELKISIGINTGNMYFGPIGTQEHLEISAYGPDINLAKRLQEAAKGGQTLVGVGSYRHTRRTFDFKRIEGLNLKGIGEGIVAYEVLNVRSQPEMLRGLEGLRAPLIGREREMEKLRTCIDGLLSGRGQIVSITGEAGIGKSRLVSELKAYLQGQSFSPHRLIASSPHQLLGAASSAPTTPPFALWLEGRCVSYGQSMNYSPFRGIIGSYLRILPTDTEEEAKAKLHEKVNALLPATHRWIPIHVGHIFFPQYEQQLRTASGDDFAKQYTYPVMRDLFQKIAAEKPLVLVFEDMHWADPSSLALLEYLMASVDEAPILYCWVYRPIRDSECWRLRERAARDFAYCNSKIDLSPLRHEETEALVCELLKIPDISERMRNLICEKALGNPLYVEEIIHSFIDEEAVVRDGEYWRAKLESVEIVAVPSETLQGVILARVDQLEREVKETLQTASVLGDSFPLSLLEKVSESAQNLNLSHLLRKLEHAELLQRRRLGSDWEYQFRHPLIHDVVYHSLLLETRSTLHEKTGATIEELYSDKLDNYTDLLAYHYGRSANVEKALHYLTLAGDKAAKLASYWEALDYYGAAMEKAESLELADDLRQKQVVVDLVIKRSEARHMLRCMKEDVEELEKYVGWAEALGDRNKIEFFYWQLGLHSFNMGEFAKTEKYNERYNALIGDPVKMIFAQVKFYLYAKANYEAAAVLAQQGIEATDKSNHQWKLLQYRLAKSYKRMGQWSKSLMACRTGLDVSIEHSDSARIIRGHETLGKIYLSMGEWEKAVAECEIALNMSPGGLAIPRVVTPLGDAYCKTGQLEKGIELLERWKSHAKRTGHGPIFECEYCLPLAEGYLAQGNREKAQANAEEALQIAQTKGYPLHEAQAHRILGEILAETDSSDFRAAEEHFSRSLEIMQRIKAKNEEGKTELSWGKACQKCGDLEKARIHLRRAMEIFEELGTTRYLEWTKEALANLG